MKSPKFLNAPVESFRNSKTEYFNQHKTRQNFEEQMAKMKKMIKSPLNKRKQEGHSCTKTFGVSLEELLRRNPESDIPKVVERITDFIRCHGIRHEGIFRVNGNVKVVERLKAEFDRDGDADLEECGDIMSVAGLMKMFLRELPEPLIPQHFKTSFIQVHKDYCADKSECHSRMRNLVQDLPKPNIQLLKFLCRFLVNISLNEDANKMHANALAIVFAPNIFRCADGIEGFREQSVINSIVTLFIEDYDILLKSENEDSPFLIHCIQVQEAKDSNFTCPPAMPIPYEEYKKLKQLSEKHNEQCEMISPYAEFRVVENDRLMINEAAKPKHECPIYATVSKAQREAILGSSICEHSSDEAEPYIRSNSPSWHKTIGEVSSPKLESSPKSRKEFMEKTIKESINELLFGHNLTSTSEESDKLDSPVEEAPPVPPRCSNLIIYDESGVIKSQKRKKRRCWKSSQDNPKISSNEGLKDNVDGAVDEGLLSETRRKHRFEDDSESTSGRPAKRTHKSKVMEVENSSQLIVNVTDYDSLRKALTKNKKLSANGENEDDLESIDLSAIKRHSEVLSCLTMNRAPPPRKRRPPSFYRSIPPKLDFKATDLDVKSDLKSLPRKPPSPPPRSTLSPSNSISPSVASKLERRKQVRSMPELAKVFGERDGELDSDSSICADDSPTTSKPKKSERIPIPPLELYKLAERTEDDPMVSPRERSGFDDAMVSPRSRRATLDIRGFSTECPPSPPAMQENHFWLDKKQNTSPKGEATIKELTKRMQSLKKKIKEFEEKFEDEHGHKPTLSQDRHPIKKYAAESNRTRKLIQELKDKRSQGDRSSGETSPQASTKGNELLLMTVPRTVEQSLKESLNKLKNKRESRGRSESIDEMSREQLQDEKLAFQKVLLQHESSFGRPTSKRERDVMKPLYDRYRMIKRKLSSFKSEPTESTSSSKPSTNEREDRKQSPERPSELELTSVGQDTLLCSPSPGDSRLTQSLPARNTKGKPQKLFEHDVSPVSPLTICVDEPEEDSTLTLDDTDYNASDDDSKDGATSTKTGNKHTLLTAKDSDAILHQASMRELLEQQASALRRKKKLRKKLKTFEDNFTKTTGRKVQREDRGAHECDYEEYKKIKARLRLLDALITKQQGNNTI